MSSHAPSGGWISICRPAFGACMALGLACPPTAMAQLTPRVIPQQPYPVLVAASDVNSRERMNGAEAGGGPCAPHVLLAPGTHLALIAKIWERSGTFRRQCSRLLGEPALRVRLNVASSYSQTQGLAATRLVRRTTGLQAEVHFADAQASRVIELIGHELEHIIEQLDGVDLAGIARRAPATVWAARPRII